MSKISPTVVSFILAILVVLFYGNTLTNGFVHDDAWQVANNPDIRSFSALPKVISGCVAQEILGGCRNRGFYWRPMQSFLYLVTYQISEKPWIFHLANLVYFWLGAVLIYQLLRQLMQISAGPASRAGASGPVRRFPRPTSSLRSNLEIKTPKSSDAAGARRGSPAPVTRSVVSSTTAARRLSIVTWLPFLATVLYVVSPVNSEAVNWVSATPELLLAIFLPLTLIFFIKYLKTKKRLNLVFSLLAFFAALVSKETAVFLVVLLPVCQFVFGGFRIRKVKLSKYRSLLWYFVPIFIYLIFRLLVLGRVVYKYEGYYALSLGGQFWTALWLYPRYLWKMIWPLPLSFQAEVLPHNAPGLWLVLSLLAILAVILAVYFAYKNKSRAAFFGVVLAVLGVIPAIVFANKLGEFIFSERYLLTSSIGFSALTMEILGRFFKKKPVLIFLFVLVYALVSLPVVLLRNRDWKDNVASYQAMVRVDAGNKKARLNLGRIYEQSGEFDLAKGEFGQVLNLDPLNSEAREAVGFLGNKFTKEGQYSFNYPLGFAVKEQKGKVLVLGQKKQIRVEISSEVKNPAQTGEQYLAGQDTIEGKLVNMGLAQIPGADVAYVKIYEDKDSGSQKLQFFLFNGTRVVKILVAGIGNQADSDSFNKILGSMKIE